MRKADSLKRGIYILFITIFLLFSILIFRLGYMQVLKGKEYTEAVKRADVTSVGYPVPRGKIYDSKHRLVVYNTGERAITYTPPKYPKPEDFLELAKKLSRHISMNEKDKQKVTERDLKDIWLLENQHGRHLITEEEEERFKKQKLTENDLYQLKLKRIKKKDLEEIDLNMAAIYRKLSSAPAFTPVMIKNEKVTDREFAAVSARLGEFPGIDVTTDWKRKRNYGDTFWNMLGGVTTDDEGLPLEKADYYMAKGYERNDRVGKSYIEEMYDEILLGRKKGLEIATNRNGEITETKVRAEGHSGYNLVLTIDMKFQEKVEKILEEELKNAMGSPYTDTLDTAFAVAIEPKTGYILAMSGKVYDREAQQFRDYTPGTFTFAFEQGSVVKGATMLAGYASGVREIGEKELDEVMRIRGSGTFSSHTVMGHINDLTALERSSNVYMWKTAIEMMGGKYVPGAPLKYDHEKIEKIRYYFHQLGLGVPTGIGFPNETAGMKGTNPGTYFQIAIGQLDTYTPMQVAQYMATIANGGYRMKPQLVKEIRKPMKKDNGPGTLVKAVNPVVLNRVEMSDEMIERVREGFWLVTHGAQGTATGFFSGEPYNPAGKTGTAESYKNGIKTWNLVFAGFAPYDEPEIAIAVTVPHAYRDGVPQPHSAANQISQRIFRAFFGLE